MTIDRRPHYYKRVLAIVIIDRAAFKDRIERGRFIQSLLKQRWQQLNSTMQGNNQ